MRAVRQRGRHLHLVRNKAKTFHLITGIKALPVATVLALSNILKPQPKNPPQKDLKVQKLSPVVVGKVFPVNYSSQKALVKHPVAFAYTAAPLLAEAPDSDASLPDPVAEQTVPVAASSAPLPAHSVIHSSFIIVSRSSYS